MPEHELPSVGGLEAAHDRLEVSFGADAVIRLDLVQPGTAVERHEGCGPVVRQVQKVTGDFVFELGSGGGSSSWRRPSAPSIDRRSFAAKAAYTCPAK